MQKDFPHLLIPSNVSQRLKIIWHGENFIEDSVCYCLLIWFHFYWGIGSVIHLPHYEYMCTHRYVWMGVHVYMCMYKYIHTNLCTNTYMHVCVCMHECACLYMFVCIHVCLKMCVFAYKEDTSSHLCISAYILYTHLLLTNCIHSQVSRLIYLEQEFALQNKETSKAVGKKEEEWLQFMHCEP